MNLETNEHMKSRLGSIFAIFKITAWILPKADSETKTGLQTVYLRGHPGGTSEEVRIIEREERNQSSMIQ